jgi:hypothetical protein
LRCGACCAFFHTSFYYGECDDETPGGVPVELTEDASVFRRAMKGTSGTSPHCIAIEGVIGQSVRCSIYERRAQVCRDFVPSFENGEYNERCDKARALHGLAPLTPEDWSAS